ncbi:MAG: hypothetical protein VR67_09975 [Peptococcaceae bacterium BRH_c8a]|nr:MAG: hypothetical protein VR67_09975 [Peptococcaceae bacterium BRH_c8a]
MTFEVYVPRSNDANVVTITKHHIRIGNKLLGKIKGDRVEIAYDRDSNKLRIRGLDEGGLILSGNKIGATGVFKYFELDERGNFQAEFNDKDNSIHVDLNERR